MEKVDLLFSGYGRFQACSQDFLPEVQVSGVGVELGCLRLHFECFEELGIISPNFTLQINSLQIDYNILQLSRMTMLDASLYLSNDIFERRTSTGSELFAILHRDLDQIFRQIVSMREKTLKSTNLVALRHMDFLPVYAHRS